MIFVTGGTGFLGRHLIPALCRAGYSLRVLTRQPEQHLWLIRYPRLEVIHGDLREAATFSQALEGCNYVVHGAGLFRFWGDAREFEATNVLGTENLMWAATEARVKRFVYISSVAVVGRPDPDSVVDEMHPAHPADPYQLSKWHAEQAVLRYFREHQLPTMILRPGAYYGPMGEYGFNRLFFRDPMRGIIMQVAGGSYIIFPVYIADVAESILQALDKGRPGEIYNICGDWITHRDAFDIICEEAGLHWPRLPIPGWLGISIARILTWIAAFTQHEPFWPINLRSYVYNYWRVSSEKARRELGFVPTGFREGAKRTIVWYRAGKPDHIPELDC
jgi:nucleoside-diphosphate-sugar epimerase